MKNIKEFFAVFFSVIVCVLAVFAITYATTTISTNIVTGGTVAIGGAGAATELSVLGTASISQDLWASGSFQFGAGEGTGTVSYSRLGSGTSGHSLADADDLLISGLLEVNDTAFFDGAASVALDLSVEGGDFSVSGDATITGNDLTFGNGAVITNTDADTLTLTELLFDLNGSLDVSNDLIVGTGPLQVAHTATVAYSRLGTGTTGHSLAAADDLLVTGLLEVDDAAYFDGIASMGNATAGIIIDDSTDGISMPATYTDGIHIAGTATNAINITGSVTTGIVISSAVKALDLTADAGAISAESHGIDLAYTGTLASGKGMVGGNFAVTTGGTAGAWASGVYAKVTQGATKNVSGYISGAEFEVINSADNVSDWFPLVLNANNSGAQVGSHASYIGIRDYGSTELESLFWFNDSDRSIATTDESKLLSTSSDQLQTHAIRILIGSTPYWIMVTNDSPD